MLKRILLAAVASAFLAGPALASSCPRHMKTVDDKLATNPTLSAAQMSEVKKYRAEGETQHKAGKHKESLDALAKAEGILGIKM
ncbi:MAG: hypothetical protein HY521_14150 [Proteobacteria bacterium]|nr:hypothetical protein [Pseudomonadota bacterium]